MLGDLESRIITLEQLAVQIRRRVRALKALADENDQNIGRFSGFGGSAPNITGVTAFPAICASIPFVLTMHDSIYGDFTLNWDSVSKWTGCKMVSWPGNLVCGAGGMTPVTFTLFGDNTTASWVLQVSWCSHVVGPGNRCPSFTATCSTTPDQIFGDTRTFNCHGTSTWGRSAGNLYVGSLPTWTITIP